MPHYPVVVDRENDEWCIWSTIVDAPISGLIDEEQVKDYFGEGSGWLTEQHEWAGSVHELSEFASFNRAGEGEAQLNERQLVSLLRSNGQFCPVRR